MNDDMNQGQDCEEADIDGEQPKKQPKSGKPSKKSKGNFIVNAISNIDANTVLNILVAPLILTTRFFSSVSDGSTTVKDVYKFALQHSFIGLGIAIVFEKPRVALAAAVGSLIFVIINYLINPSIEHADALTDTFKSFKRYSATTLMVRFVNLVPLIKINGDFENEFRIEGKKQRQIVSRPKRTVEDEIEIDMPVGDDEIETDYTNDNDIDDVSESDDLNELTDGLELETPAIDSTVIQNGFTMPPMPQVNLPPLQTMSSSMSQGAAPEPTVPVSINLPNTPFSVQNATISPPPSINSAFPPPMNVPAPPIQGAHVPQQPVVNIPQQPIPQQKATNVPAAKKQDAPNTEDSGLNGISFGVNNQKTTDAKPNQISVVDDFE